jgi:hypothetical protein
MSFRLRIRRVQPSRPRVQQQPATLPPVRAAVFTGSAGL